MQISPSYQKEYLRDAVDEAFRTGDLESALDRMMERMFCDLDVTEEEAIRLVKMMDEMEEQDQNEYPDESVTPVMEDPVEDPPAVEIYCKPAFLNADLFYDGIFVDSVQADPDKAISLLISGLSDVICANSNADFFRIKEVLAKKLESVILDIEKGKLVKKG